MMLLIAGKYRVFWCQPSLRRLAIALGQELLCAMTKLLTFRHRFRTNIWKHVRYVVSFSKFDLLATQY